MISRPALDSRARALAATAVDEALTFLIEVSESWYSTTPAVTLCISKNSRSPALRVTCWHWPAEGAHTPSPEGTASPSTRNTADFLSSARPKYTKNGLSDEGSGVSRATLS